MVDAVRPAPLKLVVPTPGAPRPLYEQTVAEALRELCAAYNRTADDVHLLSDVSSKMATEVLAIGIDVRQHNVVLARYAPAALPVPIPLPGDRRESPSSHDLAKHVSQDVIAQVRAYEANPSTPPGPPDERALAAIVEERVAAGLAVREAQRLQKALDERAAKDRQEAEDLRERQRKDDDAARKIRVQKWITALAVIAGAAAWLGEHFLK